VVKTNTNLRLSVMGNRYERNVILTTICQLQDAKSVRLIYLNLCNLRFPHVLDHSSSHCGTLTHLMYHLAKQRNEQGPIRDVTGATRSKLARRPSASVIAYTKALIFC